MKERAGEKSVFDVNVQDAESVDVLQIELVPARAPMPMVWRCCKESSRSRLRPPCIVFRLPLSKNSPQGRNQKVTFQSIEVLEKLLSDFAQKKSLSKIEENQVHAFELAKDDLTNEINNLTRSQAQEVAAAAAVREHIASLKVSCKDKVPFSYERV